MSVLRPSALNHLRAPERARRRRVISPSSAYFNPSAVSHLRDSDLGSERRTVTRGVHESSHVWDARVTRAPFTLHSMGVIRKTVPKKVGFGMRFHTLRERLTELMLLCSAQVFERMSRGWRPDSHPTHLASGLTGCRPRTRTCSEPMENPVECCFTHVRDEKMFGRTLDATLRGVRYPSSRRSLR